MGTRRGAGVNAIPEAIAKTAEAECTSRSAAPAQPTWNPAARQLMLLAVGPQAWPEPVSEAFEAGGFRVSVASSAQDAVAVLAAGVDTHGATQLLQDLGEVATRLLLHENRRREEVHVLDGNAGRQVENRLEVIFQRGTELSRFWRAHSLFRHQPILSTA